MGITAHSKTRSPPRACKPTLRNITADAADEDRSVYEVFQRQMWAVCLHHLQEWRGLRVSALILASDFLSIPVRIHSSEVESEEEAKSIRSKTSG